MHIFSRLINIVLGIASILCLSYCQKITDEDIGNSDHGDNGEAKLINVKTRSLSDSEIVFPLYAYVFKENGDFHSYLKINSVADSIQFNLGKSSYKIVTISGCGEEYSILEKPSMKELIKFKNESLKHSKRSMMMGITNITVDKKNINVELSMTYCVSSLEVALSGIPLNTKKVRFSISPLYNAINYNGEYQKSNNGDELSLDCYLGIDGIWKAGPVYIFPGCSDNTTFKISIEKESSLSNYSYIFKGSPKASQPFIVKGSFVGEVTINGNIITKGWEDPLLAEFDFSSSSGNETEEGGNEEDNNDDDAPQKGEIWNGCIVANAQSVESGTELLLLSLKEWECTYPEADDIISSYSINGITGWSLPTWEQATYLKKTFNGDKLDELNDKIEAANGYPIFDDSDTRFLCLNKDNIISSFRFTEKSVITKASNESRVYYLRIVKAYTFKKQKIYLSL